MQFRSGEGARRGCGDGVAGDLFPVVGCRDVKHAGNTLITMSARPLRVLTWHAMSARVFMARVFMTRVFIARVFIARVFIARVFIARVFMARVLTHICFVVYCQIN
jgi:hypothetical protein